jgi:uncharacterized membrane protein
VTTVLAGRWMTWALVASLALNLFLGGVVGMRLWREHRIAQERSAYAGPVGRLTAGMPETARAKVRTVLDARQQEFRERSREFRQARNAAFQTLASDAFDRTRAEAAFAEARQRATAMSELVQTVLVEAAATLTPEERKAFREGLAERERRGPRQWRQ